MQTVNERHYRLRLAQIHIFRTVLTALEARPEDDVPEPPWHERVESIRGDLHELEADLAGSVAGWRPAEAPARQWCS